MTEAEYNNLQDAFADLPLDLRQRAFTRWQNAPTTDNRRRPITIDCGSVIDCCPWGMVLVEVGGMPEYNMSRYIPAPSQVHTFINHYGRNQGIAIDPEREFSIRCFTNMVDSGRITEHDLHRIMIPEDFR